LVDAFQKATEIKNQDSPDETKGSHSNGLKVDISRRDLEYGSEDR